MCATPLKTTDSSHENKDGHQSVILKKSPNLDQGERQDNFIFKNAIFFKIMFQEYSSYIFR